jgi:hypothetical protein
MQVENSIDDLSSSELRLLDTLASLIQKPDSKLEELIKIKKANRSLNFTGEG